ncbi:hypothetical protein [Actinomadura verrucosospora]|uniref:Uncharacterized protein n=1 Tax=Actinomadura verrucosospora TaxID=46165 RepID=A0A7D3VTU9_ACTVE|nr:hypothetical protein [Actinomadura verrucosospora]QKG22693.1 hypothetical protein ACTIVE_4334 [Actinomadura verrucosospora]
MPDPAPAASDSSDASGDLDREEEGVARSCYLLEFSVGPGGARQGDVFAGTSVAELAAAFADRYDDHGADSYLVMWYGALLHLWVVQEGVIVEGIDLHPYLRTGDARCDRALARIVAAHRRDDDLWDVLDQVMEPYDFDMARALPLLAHVLDLHERSEAGDDDARSRLDRILEDAEAEKAPESYDGVTVERLVLDWDAVAAAAPPLREPVLEAEWVRVRWASKDLMHPETYLNPWGAEWVEPLHLGVNDLENGD